MKWPCLQYITIMLNLETYYKANNKSFHAVFPNWRQKTVLNICQEWKQAQLLIHLNCQFTWRWRIYVVLFFVSWRCPGPWLECVGSAYRVLTEFRLTKLCGRSMTFDLSLNRLGHQTFLILFGLQGFIPLPCLSSFDFDLLPVSFIL